MRSCSASALRNGAERFIVIWFILILLEAHTYTALFVGDRGRLGDDQALQTWVRSLCAENTEAPKE